MKAKKKISGFSLVELIIALAVVGVLTAILIPTFSNVIDKANAKSAFTDARNVSEAFITDVTNAKITEIPDLFSFVIKGGKIFTFCFDHKSGKLLEYKNNPCTYNSELSFDEQADLIMNDLQSGSTVALCSNEKMVSLFSDETMFKFLKSHKYNTKQIIVRAGSLIKSDMFIRETPEKEKITEATVIEPEFDPENNKFTFIIPEDTKGDVKLDLSSIMYNLSGDGGILMPAFYLSYRVEIKDESGRDYNITDVNFNSDIDLILERFMECDKTKKAEIENLIIEDYYPVITKSNLFKKYLESQGYTTTASYKYVEDYKYTYQNEDGSITDGNILNKTFTEYIKEYYGLPMDKPLSVSQFNIKDLISYGGLTNGNCLKDKNKEYMRHVEPEIIALMIDFFYDYLTGYTFTSMQDSVNWTQKLYGYNNKVLSTFDWMEPENNNGIKFYSLYDLVEGNMPDKLNFEKDENGVIGGYIFFYLHKMTANAYQCMSVCCDPNFDLTLTPSR